MFQLLETMKVNEDGVVALLERHLQRLAKSARYFGFKSDLDQIHAAIALKAVPGRLRLLLWRDGRHELRQDVDGFRIPGQGYHARCFD